MFIATWRLKQCLGFFYVSKLGIHFHCFDNKNSFGGKVEMVSLFMSFTNPAVNEILCMYTHLFSLLLLLPFESSISILSMLAVQYLAVQDVKGYSSEFYFFYRGLPLAPPNKVCDFLSCNLGTVL